MAINQINLPGIFKRGVSETYQDMIMPRPLFMSMAKKTTTTARFVSTEVRRWRESVAVDIKNGTPGNRNQFARMSTHLYEPPTYNENFDLTTLEIYDRVFGGRDVSEGDLADLIDTAAEKAAFLVGKIHRACELHWVGIMRNGIVVLNNGDNINYRRKAESMVNLSGNYWNGSTTTIVSNFRSACNFLRTQGKAQGGEFIAVIGESAFDAFLSSSEILNLGDQTYVQRVNINMPDDMMNGGVYHGTLSAGSYKIHLYTYPEYYDAIASDDTVTSTAFWPTNLAVVIPKMAGQFTTKFAGIKALFKGNNSMPEYYGYVRGEHFLNNFIDQKTQSHVFEVHSRPLPVPVSVDKIYTMQVLA